MPAHSDATPIIVGCGFVGKYLTNLLHTHSQSPICLVKSKTSLDTLNALGFNAQIFDLDSHDQHVDFDLADQHIYYLAPPSNNDHSDHRIDRFLSLCSATPPSKIVYISTSGVYGDCNGQWVDESQPLAPISDRAIRRVYAEKALVTFCHQHATDYVILRVGGIYGPERLPIHRLSSITVVCPDEAPYSNRIHVSDLANICHTAMLSQCANEIYNVADGHATSMTDYYYKIADFAGHSRPPCVPMSEAKDKLSVGMLSFINESRRLSTEKMLSQLKITIQFPNISAGLKDCFDKLT